MPFLLCAASAQRTCIRFRRAPAPRRRQQALLLQRTLEESTYFAVLYTMWQRDDVYFHLTAPTYFKDLPPGVFQAVTRLVKGSTLRDLHGQARCARDRARFRHCDACLVPAAHCTDPQERTRMQGMGRHPWQYVKARLAEELDVYDALLATSGAYLTGATVTLPDCFLWAMIEMARPLEACTVQHRAFRAALCWLRPTRLGQHDASQEVDNASGALQALHSVPEKEGVDYPLPGMVRERQHLIDFHARLEKTLYPEGATHTWQDDAK